MHRRASRRSTKRLKHHPRDGFSLVELLVVLAIIGLLLALALPAVQWTRESARKTQCVNKLRQLGIAMHGYAERQGRLPRDGDRDWGYGAFFLPELEQSPLFERLSPLTTTRSGGADPATTGAGLPVFHCPAYSGPATTAAGFGRSTYRGCTPVLKTRIQLSDIVDGESQTVAIGETASEHGWALPGTGDSDALPNQGGAFGSFHAGGVLFLVCDGSVRLIADGIDKTQYEALFTTAGNEPVHW